MYLRCLIIVLLLSTSVYAQDSTLRYSASLSVAGATAQTPFWMRVNQNGNIPLDGNYGIGQFGVYRIYHANNPRLAQWSAGVEGVASYGTKSITFFSDFYVAGKLGPVELMIGQKKQVTGLMDTTLTSGSMSVSGNSRPFPRIQLSIPRYYPLSFTNDYVSFKASYSEGLLRGSDILYGSVRRVERTYFHQKSFYLQWGNPSNLFQAHSGINHQVVWGGFQKIFPLRNISPANTYWHMISGKSIDYKFVGNHFGTIDLALTLNLPQWSYSIYRQSIFENGSIFKIINLSDGLNGISAKRRKSKTLLPSAFRINSFLFEFLDTKSQLNTSPPFGHSILQYGNYYNHYLYRNGWSYLGSGIGTPLIPSQDITNDDLPSNGGQFTNNNRVQAYHLGASFEWQKMAFMVKGTYSLNYGTYLTPFGSAQQQASIFLSASKQVKILGNSIVTAGLSSDFGELYSKTSGIMVSIKKSGFLN